MVQKNEVSVKNPVTVRTLVKQFLTGNDDAAMIAAWKLCLMSPSADDKAVMLAPLLLVLRADKNSKRRLLAAKILGCHCVRCDENFEALCEGLNEDVSERVRVQCALSLGLIAHPGTLQVFRQALEQEQSEYMRLGILAGLRELYCRESLELLQTIIQNGVEPENVRRMAQSVAEAVESHCPVERRRAH